MDHIWEVDLVDMRLISKYNKRIRFSLCVIDVFTKFGWLFLWKTKKCITIFNAFQNILCESKKCNSNKLMMNKGSEFHNGSIKPWL